MSDKYEEMARQFRVKNRGAFSAYLDLEAFDRELAALLRRVAEEARSGHSADCAGENQDECACGFKQDRTLAASREQVRRLRSALVPLLSMGGGTVGLESGDPRAIEARAALAETAQLKVRLVGGAGDDAQAEPTVDFTPTVADPVEDGDCITGGAETARPEEPQK